MARYALYLRGNRVYTGTWRQCIRVASSYPDADWEIVDDEANTTVTRHYPIKEESASTVKTPEEMVERFVKGVKG
jgi:hypothetical protein